MKFSTILLSALGIQSAMSWPQIQQPEKNSIIGVVNKLRRSVKPAMQNYVPVTWNYNLEQQVKDILPENRTTLFDYNYEYPPPIDIRANMNLRYITNVPSFGGIYNYVWHDTCNNAAGDVLKIFRFRANQLNCMDFKKCNDTSFTSFLTCLKKPVPRQSGLHCSWSWRYVSPLVADNLKNIACVRFSHPGPYTPSKQKDSFGCYGEYHDPISDVPYLKKLKI